MKTTIFFDLDDTLWDTIGNSRKTLEELYDEYEINRFYPTFIEFYEVYYNNTVSIWDQYSRGLIDKETLIRERFRFPFRQFSEMTDRKADEMNRDFFKQVEKKTGLIDGAIDLLDYLHPKYKMHIISNGFSEIQDNKINNSGLGGYFEHVVLSDVIGVNKPHPKIYHYLLTTARVKPEEVIMIGDNIKTDIAGAQGVGIEQIWFNERNEEAENIKPTYEVKKLYEIKSIL